MAQQLFRIGMKHKGTKKKIVLDVWALNVDEATNKLNDLFFGRFNEYEWTGSGPVYENNEIVKRDF